MTLLPYDNRESNQRYEFYPVPGSDTDRHTTKVPGSSKLPPSKDDEESIPAYELIQHLVLNTPLEVLKLNHSHIGIQPTSPSQLEAAQDTIERVGLAFWDDRKAFFEIEWKKMKSLKALFLDLRDYSTMGKCSIERRDVAALAFSLSGMNLEMLVITGLRSYDLWPGTRPLTLQDIDEKNMELDQDARGHFPIIGGTDRDGVNWFGMFRCAVQAGGKLILVDRQIDRYEMPSWRRVEVESQSVESR